MELTTLNGEEGTYIRSERYRPVRKTGFAACCVAVTLVLTPIICTIIIFLARRGIPSDRKVDALWFPSTGSESCIRLMDIDGDGLDDVIVSVTEVTTISNGIKNDTKQSARCQSFNVEEPCSGIVYGIRGYDFTILWSFRVKQSIFELVCDLLDVDNDGYRDCIGAGRQGTLVAFDPRDGTVFWDGQKIKSRQSLWNFYNPVLLPVDVDGDKMNDILISHGGNPTIPADVHEREAGCLLIISSRTGNQIGEPFWMPDGKETYMSAVLYDQSTILFGTGGETVPGGLYSISIDNIIHHRNEYVTIAQSYEKGIMVPPIVLDIDHDGVDDILVSYFDGTVELINGKTMKPLWTKVFDGFEFYASPAPGDFNSDSFVDWMIILNHGIWDRYDYSEVVILDGLTGEIIWRRKSTFAEFSSPLTFQRTKNGKYQDSFIYRQRGQSTARIYSNISSILFHGIGLQDGEIPRNESSLSSTTHHSCNTFSLNDSIVNIYLTDIEETRLIAMIYPPMDQQDHLCSNYEPMERAGGALGDLNGDGILDTVDITTFITKLTSHDLHQFLAHSVLTRFSLTSDPTEKQIVANYQADIFNRTIDQTLLNFLREKTTFPTKSIDDNDRHVVSPQTWNAYLGRFGNSHYYRKI